MNFELRHLEGFVALAEELHFARAAERLHIAQPALSQQIQKLESVLGVQLLIREKRRTRLTHVGELFLVEARRTLTQAKTAQAVADRARRGELGRLRVAYMPTTSSGPFLAMLADFRDRHAGVEVDLLELPLGTTSQPPDVDVAFISRIGSIDCPEGAILSVEPFIAALPAKHRLASHAVIEIADLADDPFVFLDLADCAEWGRTVHDMCTTAGFRPRVTHRVCQVSTQLMSVAAGLGVALVPASTEGLRREGVAFVPLKGPTAKITGAALWRGSDSSPVLARFVASLRTEDVRGVPGEVVPA
ncbi:LysR substrate-binding domain-containing protein [Herbidospora sp. NBRC 101105]|uniref:LysR substrate-binding domain-containing protein n=1 Tax=Herbidospora sp. NBRC 101105 TaxID=3032195 RepID=UPI0024A18A01|nr:LysR substrate-binding domain-containing protein [Herbidospora sp. NBRC 101105]GLX95184.1 LysR family transcriptional regulator [Herbidospora sp. NBRC 101105]